MASLAGIIGPDVHAGVRARLESLGSKIKELEGVKYREYTPLNQPTASSAWGGVSVWIRNPSGPDSIQTCMQDGRGNWKWIVTASAS